MSDAPDVDALANELAGAEDERQRRARSASSGASWGSEPADTMGSGSAIGEWHEAMRLTIEDLVSEPSVISTSGANRLGRGQEGEAATAD